MKHVSLFSGLKSSSHRDDTGKVGHTCPALYLLLRLRSLGRVVLNQWVTALRHLEF